MDICWISNYSGIICIVWWGLMKETDCDLIEVKLLDPSFTLYYKGRSKINKLKLLNEVLESKAGIKIINVKDIKKEGGWFD